MQKEKQRMGKENGRWKGGKSSDYRRRVTKAKPGEIVHHVDGNKLNNSTNNFKKVDGTGEHNKHHPEKAIKGGMMHAKKLKSTPRTLKKMVGTVKIKNKISMSGSTSNTNPIKKAKNTTIRIKKTLKPVVKKSKKC